MKKYQAYCKWQKKLYVYEGISNAVLCLEKGMWSVISVLPMEVYGQLFTTISIDKDNLYLYGRKAKYIIQSSLRDKSIGVIELSSDWMDEKGFFFSNFLVNEDGIILLPFRKSQVRVFDFCGNPVLKGWQISFAKSMDKLRRRYGIAQIRAWGAHIIHGRIFMIFTNFKRDSLAIYNIHEQKLDLLSVGEYEKLFHLDCYADSFYIQGIYKSEFQIAKIDFDGKILQKVRIDTEVNNLHIQWMDFERCILLDKNGIFVVDMDFKVSEFPTVSDEGEELTYINDNLFISPQNLIHYFDTESSTFCCFRDNTYMEKRLMDSKEYRKRMALVMTKWTISGPIEEIGEGIELKSFLEMDSSNLKKINCHSNIGVFLWENFAH